ncbi:hypothetical protein Tco_1203201 [Tanacetum coccineum]
MANVSKSISIPNEEFSDDTTPSVARKFLNEVKSTIVTLQLDARVQNFKIQFLKEAAKFVRDFKSLAKEADESMVKQKALELEIERLLRDFVSQDIMSIVQCKSVVDTSNLQTELELNSNSVPTTKESKVVDNEKVIVPGMFRINPLRTLGKKRVDITTKTRRLQPRSNTKNDRVPSAYKSSRIKNKEVEVEEHSRNLLLSKNKKHLSSECNNIKLAIRNDKYEIVCAMCKQCLITANHNVCVLNYVNGMNSLALNKNINVENVENQKKHKPKVKKPKKVGSKERLASPKPSAPRSCI